MMADLLSPLEQPFWDKYTAGLLAFDQNTLKPWDPSCPPAEKLRDELKKSIDKFTLPQRPTELSEPYDLETVKRLLWVARRIYNNKDNSQRHWQSLNLTYEALWLILSEEPLVKPKLQSNNHSREKLELLANGLVLWDKNSAWLGVSDIEPFSTLRVTADRMWIYLYGFAYEKKAIQIISTIAYALMRTGHLSGALEALQWALQQPDLDEGAQRDLKGAMAGLLGRLREHTQALKLHQEVDDLVTQHLPDTPESKTHRKGSQLLDKLRGGNTAAESEIPEVLDALTNTRHVGFHLQFLQGLADYYINAKRDDKAEPVVLNALQLIETNQTSYHDYREQFEELKDFLLARGSWHSFGYQVQYYSCFISYSHEDEDFAKRLCNALQSKGVICWFAPHNIQGGKKIHEQIDEAIRIYDKLLLVLTEHSMQSNWVKSEIRRARQAERIENRDKLFPIRLVDMDAIYDWEFFNADMGEDLDAEIREYFIPDFSNWTDHDSFESAFERLLRDLKADDTKTSA